MRNFLSTVLGLFGGRAQATAKTTDSATDTMEIPAAAVDPWPAEATEVPLELTIWMIERDRYGVRGRALCTDIEVYASEAVVLCDGVSGYVVGTPNGETVVVEARSGGLVGHSVEAVLDGIRDMPTSELIRQIDAGRKEFNRMTQLALSNEEFWATLKMGDAETESVECQEFCQS